MNAITEERMNEGIKEYLGDWPGYTPSQGTWEPETVLVKDARAAVDESKKKKHQHRTGPLSKR